MKSVINEMQKVFNEPLSNKLSIKAFGMTHTGRVKSKNEDNYCIDSGLNLYIVSDGIGGRRAGEMASSVVVNVLPLQMINRLGTISKSQNKHYCKQAESALKQAIKDVSLQLRHYSSNMEGLRGTGATIAACLIVEDKALIAHLGDSRVYLLRQEKFEQLTWDHSLVGALMKMGHLTEEGAKIHPARHAITHYVGMKSGEEPETKIINIEKGDRILLCTDGLTNMIPDLQLSELLGQEKSLDIICCEMIDEANSAGGKDNITVVVMDVE